MAGGYFTLLGSLPHLPHFERAERLPITRLKLEQRLKMLDPEDAEIVSRVESLASWQMILTKPRTDGAMLARYRMELDAAVTHPALRQFLEYRLGLQSVLTALRRKQAGKPPPARGEDWGGGAWAATIEIHWNDPDFRLAHVHPWLPAARNLLETGNALALEKLLLNQLWNELGRIAEADPFGFGAVVAYLFRWDILHYWLARDAAAATARFQELINEVIHDH